MGDLWEDTCLVEIEPGCYRGVVSPDWKFMVPNGGYLATMALRAVERHTDKEFPASVSCQFLRVPREGEIDIHVEVIRSSAAADAVRVSMDQRGRRVLDGLVWSIHRAEGLEHASGSMPAVPPPESLRSNAELEPEPPISFPIMQQIEERPVEFISAEAAMIARAPRYVAWYRFRGQSRWESPYVNAGRVIVVADFLPAYCAFLACDGLPPYAYPTIHLSVELYGPIEGDWLLVEGVSPVARHGLVAGQARAWSEQGTLLAISTCQMLCRGGGPL